MTHAENGMFGFIDILSLFGGGLPPKKKNHTPFSRIDYSNDKTKNIRTHTVNDVLVMPASHGMKNDACCRSSEHTSSIFLSDNTV